MNNIVRVGMNLFHIDNLQCKALLPCTQKLYKSKSKRLHHYMTLKNKIKYGVDVYNYNLQDYMKDRSYNWTSE